MNVMIVGYGRMGKEIESILIQRGHKVVCRVDKGGFGNASELSLELLKDVDVSIEFALPDGLEENIKLYNKAKVPFVLGTTGWHNRFNEVKDLVINNKGSMLYGSNFSVGAHIFFNLVARAAKIINNVPEYDIMMVEYHHNKKKDSPSGTALTAANKILENNNKKTEIWTDKLDREIKENELHVASVRGGYIPGIHSVTLDSPADSIEITHNARNRSGFALGSVMAAEWLIGKTGFFSVEDFIEDLLINI